MSIILPLQHSHMKVSSFINLSLTYLLCMLSLFPYEFCLPDTCHKFEITDSYGDGFEDGSGYVLVVDGEKLSSGLGTNFDDSDSMTFGDDCAPTPFPTMFPTPESSSPCDDDDLVVQLYLQTDNYPNETSWAIIDSDDNILESESEYDAVGELYSYFFCLPDTDCYSFEIYDSYGDGIDPYYGGYAFYVNGEALAGSYDFGYSEVTPFGDCSTLAPSLTSMSPSNSPTSYPTKETSFGQFLIASDYDPSLCVHAKIRDNGARFKLKACDKFDAKQRFMIHSPYGQISTASDPSLCMARDPTSQLNLVDCASMPDDEDQMWAYDKFSSDIMLRAKGFRVLSTIDTSEPVEGLRLRVRKKDFTLTSGGQGWKLIYV